MKQVQLKDAQENFVQIFQDVLMSGEPVEILKLTLLNNAETCSIISEVDKRRAGHRDQRLQLRPKKK
ncbi:hypothetical protein N9573_00925 [Octadecabacter sp.]|nr:hypothetical protein [Octadecabacter sp.]